MARTARRNTLESQGISRSASLEFAVHGRWRCEGDQNGEHGCWHVGVRELVEAFGADAVREKLAAFAAAQTAAREEAITAAESAIAAEAEEAEEVAHAPGAAG